MNKPIAILLIYICSTTAYPQCNCTEELSSLIQKVETNYPGYLFEITSINHKYYEDFKTRIRTKAKSTTQDDCYNVLTEYTDYFHDGHLSISESPSATDKQIDSLKNNAPHYSITEAEAREYYTVHVKDINPIEGIWQNNTYKIAIKKTGKNLFYGVMLHSSNTNWSAGQIKVELEEKSPGTYAAILYIGNHLKTHTHASISKDVLMNLGPFKWAKTFPVHPNIDYVDTANPERPTLQRLDADNLLLTLPSFLTEKDYLDSLLKRHDTELRSTKNLIIDMRGNLGGNMIYQNLLPYLYTNPMRQYGSKSMATEENIDYFKRMVKRARENGYENKWADEKGRLLEQNKGKIVDILAPDSLVLDTIFEFPKRVGIITDRSNHSSAEAFLKYYAKQSKKVIQFGDRTGGTLDYGTLNGIFLDCPSDPYVLYYPIFFENNLPQAGINKTGIIPDVKIDPGTADKIEFVKQYLATLNQ